MPDPDRRREDVLLREGLKRTSGYAAWLLPQPGLGAVESRQAPPARLDFGLFSVSIRRSRNILRATAAPFRRRADVRTFSTLF